jgi:hypothetical protein
VQRFRGGLVFKARRLCVSLNSRLESKEEEKEEEEPAGQGPPKHQDGQVDSDQGVVNRELSLSQALVGRARPRQART